MDTTRVALRFRDPAIDIDTIQEHRSIIQQEGAVWWGWWKKVFEPDRADLFHALGAKPAHAFLIDRATRRAFRAKFLKAFISGEDSADTKRIPKYYRDKANLVAGWFLLTSLEDVVYPADIGALFGETTVVDLENLPASPVGSVGVIKAGKRTGVLHLSDLHFGADYDFLPPGKTPSLGEIRGRLTDCVIEDLTRINMRNNIAAILVTGDFTTHGDWTDATKNLILTEFKSLREALGISKEHIIAIPGNHDVVRYPADAKVDPAEIAVAQQTEYKHENDFRLFSEKLTGRHWETPLNHNVLLSLGDMDIVVCALNSCTIAPTKWTEYGYVGTLGMDALTSVATMKVTRPTFRMMALHHHLVPVNKVEAPQADGVSLTLDAVKLLDAAQKANFQIAVHGHQHVPRVASYQHIPLRDETKRAGMVIVSGGSASVVSTRRGAERNTYSVFDFHSGKANLHMRELRPDAVAGASLFKGDLAVLPIIPPS